MVYLNYAIPDAGAGGDLGAPVEKLRAICRARGRTARFEYIAGEAPDLERSLLAEGFRREAEARLMICTRETYTPMRIPEDLSISSLTPESPIEELILQARTARRAFSDDTEPTLEEAEKMRTDLAHGRAFLARLGGVPAAAGLFSGPEGGISELAGVGTLEAFRGRGVGAAIVSRATEEAFSSGVDLLFLSTITEQAGRLYERVGFRFLTTMLFCIDGTG